MSEPEIEWVEDVPDKAGQTNWLRKLMPLVSNPNCWARIHVAESPASAGSTQSNLQSRTVRIPHPTHQWTFVQRGCEVFGLYEGESLQEGVAKRRAGEASREKHRATRAKTRARKATEAKEG